MYLTYLTPFPVPEKMFHSVVNLGFQAKTRLSTRRPGLRKSRAAFRRHPGLTSFGAPILSVTPNRSSPTRRPVVPSKTRRSRHFFLEKFVRRRTVLARGNHFV